MNSLYIQNVSKCQDGTDSDKKILSTEIIIICP